MSGGISLGKVKVLSDTGRAILVRGKVNWEVKDDATSPNELWVPLSVVHDDSEVYEDMVGEEGDLVVEEWWAEKHNLV